MKTTVPISPWLAFCAAAFLATPIHAAVTNVAWYRLGENDPGAASGVTATNTANLLGFNLLKSIGSPRYTNAVSPSAASSLAVHFNGTNQFFTNAIISTAVNNFGIEAWVKPNTTNPGPQMIVENGSSAGGWGIFQNGNGYFVRFGGVAVFGNGIASTGTWAHVALVRDNGLSTVYVNGVSAGTNANAPNPPAGVFGIGALASPPGLWFFNGTIDEVRVFTFAAGQFSTNDLLVNALATTLPASGFAPGTATLNGRVSSVGFPTTAWFEWGTTTNLGNLTAPQAFGSTFGTTNFSQVLTGLTAGVTYFRAVATNDLGLAFGAIQSFVLGPSVQTLPATGFTNTGATLNGVVNPNTNATTAWFEYGFTTNYGTVTPPQGLGSGNANTNFSQALTNLFGGVTYHFRAVASNSFGVVFGNDQSFGPLPAFYDIGAGLPGTFSPAAWGDYDNDGRLDIVLAGLPDSLDVVSPGRVYRNTGTGFTNTAILPGGAYDGSVAWGDYDNDGQLDILLTGDTYFSRLSQVFRNTGGGFTNIQAGLTPVEASSAAWGDSDNDGRLDILLTGINTNGAFSQVWRNTSKEFANPNSGLTVEFADIHAGLTGVFYGSSAWGDYDKDGRLDMVLTGATNYSSFNYPSILSFSQILRNTGTGFTNINAGLSPVAYSSVAWGDYDNDGRLDILLTGTTNGAGDAQFPVAQVWRNTGTGFTNINAGLPGVFRGSAAWGDYDNDGRLDILLAGGTTVLPHGDPPAPATNTICQVWRNTGSGFTNINAALPGVVYGSAVWGDSDNDGRLDILLTGSTNGQGAYISQVWRNRTPPTNTPPTAPTGLNVTLAGSTATFTWNSASDAQTPASGLSYNLRVGTTPGGSDLVAPMAAASGLRRLPQLGNAQMVTFRSIGNIPPGQPIYWSVQAIDTAFAGSPFAPEQSFTFNTVFTPTNGIPVLGDADGDGIMSESEFAAALTNLNGNGIVTEAELNLVLSNYFPTSPFLYMTNVAGLGGTNVTFALTNSFVGAFSVEFTTNLVDWYFLGPATPRYLFTDTNAPAIPQRYYRLRWP